LTIICSFIATTADVLSPIMH